MKVAGWEVNSRNIWDQSDESKKSRGRAQGKSGDLR
jgi:hypothetical protein